MNESRSSASNTQAESQSGSLALPMGVVVITLVIMIGFQTVQLWRERQALEVALENQSQALLEATRVRKQFEAIAKGSAELAGAGNQNAMAIVTALQKSGVNFQNTPPQE